MGMKLQGWIEPATCHMLHVICLFAIFVLCPHLQDDDTPAPLSDCKRFGRQMVLDGFGLEGMSPLFLEGFLTPNRHDSGFRKAQLSLKSAKVIVVGARGLGCLVWQYNIYGLLD